MDTATRLLFSKELFAVLEKYSCYGLVGIVVDSARIPTAMQFVMPKEPVLLYDVFYDALNRMIEVVGGGPVAEQGEAYFPGSKSDNSEMPF